MDTWQSHTLELLFTNKSGQIDLIVPPVFLSASLFLSIHRNTDRLVTDDDDGGDCAGEDSDDSEEL